MVVSGDEEFWQLAMSAGLRYNKKGNVRVVVLAQREGRSELPERRNGMTGHIDQSEMLQTKGVEL